MARSSRLFEVEEGRFNLLGLYSDGRYRTRIYWFPRHGIAAASFGTDHRMAFAESKLVCLNVSALVGLISQVQITLKMICPRTRTLPICRARNRTRSMTWPMSQIRQKSPN